MLVSLYYGNILPYIGTAVYSNEKASSLIKDLVKKGKLLLIRVRNGMSFFGFTGYIGTSVIGFWLLI